MNKNKKFKDGERVKVKNKNDILQTLDDNRCYEGLCFTKEMEKYCEKEFTIQKEVKKVIDYYNHGVRILKNTYILKGLHCHGTYEYPDCDRTCFIFWKNNWLEKIV